MKEIIEIDEEIYKSIKIGMRNRDDMAEIGEAVENGTPIPDNATNSDVIRTLFPDGIPKDIVWTLQDDKGAEWWNAPYQKGGK